MAFDRALSLVLLSAALLAPEARAAPPQPLPPAQTLDAPWPDPDPKSWWDDKREKPAEAADPLAGRRVGRNPSPVRIGADPLLYRLWGLPPLQAETLKSGEAILEMWVRPSLSVRQSVVRVVVRRDGDAFVQARAGLGCCTPEIGRRVGFDARLEAGSAQRFLALKDDPLWDAPRDVRVVESEGTSDAVCVNGVAYDLILVTAERARSVRRACDSAEIGQAAEVLQALLGAALGHDPRFDVIFPGGADYAADRRAYQSLIAGGGALKPAANARPQPEQPAPEATPQN
ncbi:MAG TPA: hypothetical protein VFW47_16650 [Phenylobacterium sp.]|nr:hypothetical protein [Phenylobacterium sp.]